MKKNYENPTIQVACVSAEDVLTLSYQLRGIGSIIDWGSDTTSERNNVSI